jgi:DNA-binding NtrC family response regulator
VPTALLVDDDRTTLESLAEWVQQEGFNVQTAGDLASAKEKLPEQVPDLLLLDLKLPDGNGLELLDDIEDESPTDIVVITGHGTIDTAMEAVRGGAIDYLTKPVDLPRLRRILAKVKRAGELRQEVARLRGELRDLGRFGRLVGASPAMQPVYNLSERVAPTKATVLIVGETGTGKELVAQTIHELSRRSKSAFLPINCGAVPENLIESELFGHEQGSFTGASRKHQGIFERADGGTLFLDEITEMPSELQVKLLRVLETGAFTRVGGKQPVHVDVRVIAATNRDPQQALDEGKLRKDLLYRLAVFPIEVPPLRERGGDVDLLADSFLATLNRDAETAKTITAAARQRLRDYSWPGNVRELKNVLERSFIMATDEIDVDQLPFGDNLMVAPAAASGALGIQIGMSIAEAERRMILATLEHFDGDKKKTAETLGVSLKTVYNRLHAYESNGD